jgi:hypothetical protein
LLQRGQLENLTGLNLTAARLYRKTNGRRATAEQAFTPRFSSDLRYAFGLKLLWKSIADVSTDLILAMTAAVPATTMSAAVSTTRPLAAGTVASSVPVLPAVQTAVPISVVAVITSATDENAAIHGRVSVIVGCRIARVVRLGIAVARCDDTAA